MIYKIGLIVLLCNKYVSSSQVRSPLVLTVHLNKMRVVGPFQSSRHSGKGSLETIFWRENDNICRVSLCTVPQVGCLIIHLCSSVSFLCLFHVYWLWGQILRDHLWKAHFAFGFIVSSLLLTSFIFLSTAKIFGQSGYAFCFLLIFNICFLLSGHFLFLRVRETNSLRQASVQSSLFSLPFSTTDACQVCIKTQSQSSALTFRSFSCAAQEIVIMCLCRCVSLCTSMGTLVVLCWWL